MKKIDIGIAYQEIGKCKRPIAINNLLAVFSHFLKDATENSPIFIESKEKLGEEQYNILMNTLVFAICSKCMQSSMPKREYEEYSKQITIEVEEKCDPSKAN